MPSAVDNAYRGAWIYNFFNQPTARILNGCEMINVNMSGQTPPFQNVEPGLYRRLAWFIWQDNNLSSALNNRVGTAFDSPDDNVATNPDIGGTKDTLKPWPRVCKGILRFCRSDAGAELTWHTNPPSPNCVLGRLPNLTCSWAWWMLWWRNGKYYEAQQLPAFQDSWHEQFPTRNSRRPNLNQWPDMPKHTEPPDTSLSTLQICSL